MISLKLLKNSFHYALEGFQFAWKNDQNIRIHTLAAILVIALGVVLRVDSIEMGILVAMIVLVMAAEMINTAIEKMVDLITKEYNLDAKVAKDVSSAMVLTVAIGAAFTGIYIFAPYLLNLL